MSQACRCGSAGPALGYEARNDYRSFPSLRSVPDDKRGEHAGRRRAAFVLSGSVLSVSVLGVAALDVSVLDVSSVSVCPPGHLDGGRSPTPKVKASRDSSGLKVNSPSAKVIRGVRVKQPLSEV